MEVDLRNLLDKIYELEGLVHLSLKRDELSSEILRLVSKKGAEIGNICNELSAEKNVVSKNDVNQDASFNLEEYSLEEDSLSHDIESSLNSDIPKEKQPKKSLERQRGRLVFSLNDRFRFKKELFEDSDADFNNTLALIASMEDFDEAEDYFINEERMDKNNPVVREFLVIIKRYFS